MTSITTSALPRPDDIVIPPDVLQSVTDGQAAFLEGISRVRRDKIAADLLDPGKGRQQAAVLGRFCQLGGRRILEIGSGLGVNLCVWARHYGADICGVEPGGAGFGGSLAISRRIMTANGIDPCRILDAVGESLPLRSGSFDIVYTTNVLEHVDDPAQTFREALRVLRPGGVLQAVYPNYRSFFDGHYAVFHPPVFFRSFFPWYIGAVCRRDPAFARTIRTELNVGWARRQLRQMARTSAFTVLSLGEELFLERMMQANFGAWNGLGMVRSLVLAARAAGINRIAARVLTALEAWTPVVITLRKDPG